MAQSSGSQGQAGSRDSASTVVDRIANEIRSGIEQGRYAPGQRLIEADLTELLGVSRSALREAMLRLAGERLLIVRPNRGVMVRALKADEIRQIYEVREVLEGLSASLAAANIPEGKNLDKFKKAWNKIDADYAKGKGDNYMSLNVRFHRLIVDLANNEELANAIEQLRLPIFRSQFRSLIASSEIERSHKEHRAIAEAISSANTKLAERLMRRHVRNSWKLISSASDNS